MRLALDTNAYRAFCKNDPHVVDLVQKAEEIILPFAVLGELRAGFLGGSRKAENEKVFNRFLNSARVTVLYPDEQTLHHYARVFNQLKKQGTPIPTNDIWIASIVIQYNLPLVTFDSDFGNLPQIEVI